MSIETLTLELEEHNYSPHNEDTLIRFETEVDTYPAIH